MIPRLVLLNNTIRRTLFHYLLISLAVSLISLDSGPLFKQQQLVTLPRFNEMHITKA